MLTINKQENPDLFKDVFKNIPALIHHDEEEFLKKYYGTDDPIDTIRIKGDSSVIIRSSRPRILITGTRVPSMERMAYTRMAVKALLENPAKPVILTGLATGTEWAAIIAAKNNGVPVAAMMATGFDTIYPYDARKIVSDLSAITAEAALMAIFPDGTAPMAWNFIVKTRALVLMSDAVLIPASKVKGSSMVAARLAYDLGIPVYAIPGNPDDITAKGCNAIINEGIAKIVTDIHELSSIDFSR